MSDEVRAPVEAGAGVVVHPRQESEQAVRSWLLLTVESVDRARTEWQEGGIALLRCGALFAAVRMAGDLVRAAAGSDVFVDQQSSRYYALAPTSTADRGEWRGRRRTEPSASAVTPISACRARSSMIRSSTSFTGGFLWVLTATSPTPRCYTRRSTTPRTLHMRSVSTDPSANGGRCDHQ